MQLKKIILVFIVCVMQQINVFGSQASGTSETFKLLIDEVNKPFGQTPAGVYSSLTNLHPVYQPITPQEQPALPFPVFTGEDPVEDCSEKCHKEFCATKDWMQNLSSSRKLLVAITAIIPYADKKITEILFGLRSKKPEEQEAGLKKLLSEQKPPSFTQQLAKQLKEYKKSRTLSDSQTEEIDNVLSIVQKPGSEFAKIDNVLDELFKSQQAPEPQKSINSSFFEKIINLNSSPNILSRYLALIGLFFFSPLTVWNQAGLWAIHFTIETFHSSSSDSDGCCDHNGMCYRKVVGAVVLAGIFTFCLTVSNK